MGGGRGGRGDGDGGSGGAGGLGGGAGLGGGRRHAVNVLVHKLLTESQQPLQQGLVAEQGRLATRQGCRGGGSSAEQQAVGR